LTETRLCSIRSEYVPSGAKRQSMRISTTNALSSIHEIQQYLGYQGWKNVA
jgi:hypothetical protein